MRFGRGLEHLGGAFFECRFRLAFGGGFTFRGVFLDSSWRWVLSQEPSPRSPAGAANAEIAPRKVRVAPEGRVGGSEGEFFDITLL